MLAIEEMHEADWPAVRAVYAEGIETGQATFEEEPPSSRDWDRDHLTRCRLVARIDGEVAAWAALSPVSRRHVYRGVAEVSMYVAHLGAGRPVGPRGSAICVHPAHADCES